MNTMTLDERTRFDLCADSFEGLSVGDALGSQFFLAGRSLHELRAGSAPPGPWQWTDDTEMAYSIVCELYQHRCIDQDRLALAFAQRFEPYRGYGPGAVTILRQIRQGTPWRQAAAAAFDGQGSRGNGAAMRVAPLGAYFADDPEHAAVQAALSAEVTHVHPEGIAGAVATAVAAAIAGDARLAGIRPSPEGFLDTVLPYLDIPSRSSSGQAGTVKHGIGQALSMLGSTVAQAAGALGNGSAVTAPDTVPFALWTAATYLEDYPTAIAACVEAGGDIDTTAAIVGGIVAAFTGCGTRPTAVGVPQLWLNRREELPD